MNYIQSRAVTYNGRIRVYVNHLAINPAPVAYDIDLDPAIRQNFIVAELLALRHAMSVRHLVGDRSWHGRGAQLRVTHGAIRKLMRQDSSYQALGLYAQSLQTRYQGVDIVIDKTASEWMADDYVVETIKLDPAPVSETFETPFGVFVPTLHILERMVERGMTVSLDRAMDVLIGQLRSKDTIKLDWVNKEAERCRARYGKDSELLLHRGSQNLFVITHEPNGHLRLVTTYKLNAYSKSKYKEAELA